LSRKCECGNVIPVSIIFNGQKKYLTNRKRCLKCSPFRLERASQNKDTNNPYKDWDENEKKKFSIYISTKGRVKKEELVGLYGGGCVICGYRKCLRALSFHHLDPKQKCFILNSNELRRRNWNQILEEASKCQLLCLNCHAEIEEQKTQQLMIEHWNGKELESFLKNPKWRKKDSTRNAIQKPTRDELLATLKTVKTRRALIKHYKTSSKTISKWFKEYNISLVLPSHKPPKEILENLIWEMPFTKIGVKYGVSDNAVRKWAKSYSISEYPPTGYWLRRQ
jgi:hypothetical protein